MIPGGGKALRQPGEQSFAVVKDFAHLAMHQRGRTDDLSSKHLADGLMAETHAQYRSGLMKISDHVFSDSGIRRCARSGRNDNAGGFKLLNLLERNLVVSNHAQFSAEFAEILHKVVRE